MRALMWFTLGFGGACALCAAAIWSTALWIPGILFGCAALAAARMGIRWKRAAPVALVLLGLCGGCFRFQWVQTRYLSPLAGLDGMTVPLRITAENFSRQGLYGETADGSLLWAGQRYRVQVYLREDVCLEPGDALDAEFRIRVTAPDGESASAYYQGKGVFLTATQKSDGSVSARAEESLRFLPARLAHRISELLDACLPEDAAPFAHALLLGDASHLDYETDTALKISGIRHVAAVSGLHVGILYGLIAFLTGKRKYLTALLGFPVLFLFAAVAGFTPSVTRACAMIALMMVAELFSKEYDPATALSFAVLLLLLGNPFCVVSVSFQLSVASVAGILLFYSGLYRYLTKGLDRLPKKCFRARLSRWAAGSLSVTLSAMVLTTPLSARYFGCVSLISAVTNLLTLWAVTVTFYALAAVCALGTVSLPAGAFLGSLAAWPIRYVLWMAGALSRFPLAAVYTDSPYVRAWLALCLLLLALFLVIRKRPGLFLAAGTASLAVAVCLSWGLPRRDDFRATIMDVGQGQCILLQSRGHSFLVDCGGDSDTSAADTAAGILLSQGIFRLDGAALTHGDRDHSGALENLLTRVDTQTIYLSEAVEAPLREALKESSDMMLVENRCEIPLGAGTVRLYPAVRGAGTNENSMCVLFETEKCAILITGDRGEAGEQILARSWELPDVDILVAGHHGSRHSTSRLLLETVHPETVVISVGENNIYGHPAPELLARLEEFGCTVYRTDQAGTIQFWR